MCLHENHKQEEQLTFIVIANDILKPCLIIKKIKKQIFICITSSFRIMTEKANSVNPSQPDCRL